MNWKCGVGCFQFSVSGVDGVGIDGGALDAQCGTNGCIGFSFTGGSLASGQGTLASITFTETSDGSTISLGGVVLSNSEFKHELESTLEPFKNLLLGLFFMAVGASINFIVIAKSPFTIGGILLAIIVLKAAVLFITAQVFKLKLAQLFFGGGAD